MSLFHPVPREQLGTTFTHYGWMFGIVPVYVGALDREGPNVSARNWVPEFWFDLGAALFGVFCLATAMLNPSFEPSFPIKLTGPLPGVDDARN